MHIDLSKLELMALKAMYRYEDDRLKKMLLNGDQWHEVREQRKKVTDLAIAVHKKLQSMGLNPAEFSSDDIEGR